MTDNYNISFVKATFDGVVVLTAGYEDSEPLNKAIERMMGRVTLKRKNRRYLNAKVDIFYYDKKICVFEQHFL